MYRNPVYLCKKWLSLQNPRFVGWTHLVEGQIAVHKITCEELGQIGNYGGGIK
jgi:hypothetical protein